MSVPEAGRLAQGRHQCTGCCCMPRHRHSNGDADDDDDDDDDLVILKKLFEQDTWLCKNPLFCKSYYYCRTTLYARAAYTMSFWLLRRALCQNCCESSGFKEKLSLVTGCCIKGSGRLEIRIPFPWRYQNCKFLPVYSSQASATVASCWHWASDFIDLQLAFTVRDSDQNFTDCHQHIELLSNVSRGFAAIKTPGLLLSASAPHVKYTDYTECRQRRSPSSSWVVQQRRSLSTDIETCRLTEARYLDSLAPTGFSCENQICQHSVQN